jgi:response regulator receiver domain-containing protein
VLLVLRMNAHGIIRILVVDSNAIVREGIRTIIETQSDMSVIVETSDGRNALELFPQHCPDIVVTELRLPSACGVQLCACSSHILSAQKSALSSPENLKPSSAICLPLSHRPSVERRRERPTEQTPRGLHAVQPRQRIRALRCPALAL